MELAILIITALIILGFFIKSKGTLHSHWNTLIPNFKYSTKDFYQLLKEELKNSGIEGVRMWEESMSVGNAVAGKRLYLRVIWKEFQYDCCFAPFGNGSFVSWWLMSKENDFDIFLSKIPFIGGWLLRVVSPMTYYRMDTASMFRAYAQNAITKVIDDITKESGYRLSDDERKPQVKDVFQR